MQEYPDEQVAFIRPPALPGVEVLVAEHSPRLWRVYHDTYSICTVLDRGPRLATDWRYRAHDYVATERSLMMMEPGELHVTKRHSSPGSFRVLMMNPSVVQTLAHECGQRNVDVRLRIVQENTPPLFRAFAALHERIESSAEPLEVQEHFQRALCLWLEQCTETRAMRVPKPSTRRIATAVDYLHAHHAQLVTLDELAAVADVTPWQLTRMFNRHMGCTPHRYLLGLRLSRARRLLRSGQAVADVAVAVGFANEAALARRFQEAWGIAPGRYAELVAVKK